jgi:hypothetical protein
VRTQQLSATHRPKIADSQHVNTIMPIFQLDNLEFQSEVHIP